MSDIRTRINKDITLPEGYHVEYGGQFESQQAASRTLLIASLLSILVIFLLLYMEFRNARESGIILLNLPFALIGGVLVLRFTSGEVSIPAIIGFISLFGIATRNGMLLITRYNILRNQGMTLREIQSPMAIVILGGLITSTLLNFYIIPIVYLRLHRNDNQTRQLPDPDNESIKLSDK